VNNNSVAIESANCGIRKYLETKNKEYLEEVYLSLKKSAIAQAMYYYGNIIREREEAESIGHNLATDIVEKIITDGMPETVNSLFIRKTIRAYLPSGARHSGMDRRTVYMEEMPDVIDGMVQEDKTIKTIETAMSFQKALEQIRKCVAEMTPVECKKTTAIISNLIITSAVTGYSFEPFRKIQSIRLVDAIASVVGVEE